MSLLRVLAISDDCGGGDESSEVDCSVADGSADESSGTLRLEVVSSSSAERAGV